MAKQSQIEKAIAALDAEINVLTHARAKLYEQLDVTAQKKAQKKQPKLKAVADAS